MRLLLFALAAALGGGALPAGAEVSHLGRTLTQWRMTLDSEQQIDRMLGARAIGEMAIAGQDGAVPALFAALTHEDPAVRYWAAVATARLEGPGDAGTEALDRLLVDDVPEIRVQAAVALIRAGARDKALAAFGELLKHRNRGVRLHAVHAADALGEQARPLTAALREAVEDDFDYVQRVARHALWTLGERRCPYRSCE